MNMNDSSSIEMQLLESFRARNMHAARELRREGSHSDVSEIGNLEYKPTCSVSLQSSHLLCNLTMWSSGECDLLVTNETAEQVLINETTF